MDSRKLDRKLRKSGFLCEENREPQTLEDAVEYCHRPRRRLNLNTLMNQTRKAEINVRVWNERLDACRTELTQRRSEIAGQLDNLQAILSEIDRHADSRLR